MNNICNNCKKPIPDTDVGWEACCNDCSPSWSDDGYKVLLKEIRKQKKELNLTVELHAPDGLNKSVVYKLPEDLKGFIELINKFSKIKGYSFTLSKVNIKK